MKFNFSRKINLANIDKEQWPFETEDITATDADSLDEAKNAVEKFVAERIGYYRALSEARKTATPYQAPLMQAAPAPRMGFPSVTAPAPEVPPASVSVPDNTPDEFKGL